MEMNGGTALKGRHLNSLGRQPQVDAYPIIPSPEGAAFDGTTNVAPSGLRLVWRTRYLGLAPQAIQISPLQGGFPSLSEQLGEVHGS
jgi:hypothetical protein